MLFCFVFVNYAAMLSVTCTCIYTIIHSLYQLNKICLYISCFLLVNYAVGRGERVLGKCLLEGQIYLILKIGLLEVDLFFTVGHM